jgi:diamine N-acetyltransferase
MYLINKVSPDEIDILQKLSKQTFFESFSWGNTEENMARYLEEGFSIEKLSRELNDENTTFFFVKDGQVVIGYIKLNEGLSQTEHQEEDSLEIERIYVLKEYQGKGIGNELLNLAKHIANQKNAPYIWLGVWEENKKAIAFYDKNGFITFDQHVFMVGEDRQIDLMMKLVCRNKDK